MDRTTLAPRLTAYDRHRAMIDLLTRRGCSFSHIEDQIDALREAPHIKDALWLLAWASQPDDEEKRAIGRALDA